MERKQTLLLKMKCKSQLITIIIIKCEIRVRNSLSAPIKNAAFIIDRY